MCYMLYIFYMLYTFGHFRLVAVVTWLGLLLRQFEVADRLAPNNIRPGQLLFEVCSQPLPRADTHVMQVPPPSRARGEA